MHVRHDLKLPTNNNQTNNLCESSFRILKDILFQRIRCFNLPDLTEMLLTDDHPYFESELIDVGNRRFSNAVHNRSADLKVHLFSRPSCVHLRQDIHGGVSNLCGHKLSHG